MINLPKDLAYEIKARQTYYDYVRHMLIAPMWDDLAPAEKAFWIREVKAKMEYTIK